MKKALLLIVGLGLILAGCAFQEGTGSVQLKLPGAVSRAVAGQGTVRVSLYRYGSALPIDGVKTVIEQAVNSGDVIEITNLQAGPGYRLAMSLGAYADEAKTVFHPAQFGTSQEFTVSSGLASPISLALSKSPFTWDSDAANVSYAVTGSGAGAQLWLYAANQLKRLDGAAPAVVVADVSAQLPGRTVNSITNGKRFATVEGAADNSFIDQLWFNTTKGIVPYEGTFSTNFMKAGMSPDVLSSTALTIKPSATEKTKLVVFYSGTGMTMGGAGIDDPAVAPADWVWADLASNFDSLGEFKDMLSSGADVLKSVAVGDGFYYVATSLNTFRIDSTLTAEFPKDDVTTWVMQKILNNSEVIVSIPGEQIGQVATAGSMLYAGTSHGLYVSAINAVGKPAGLVLVGSPKDRIVSLSATKYGTTVYAAAVSAAGKLVLIKDNAVAKEYDAMAGVPTGKVIPTWWNRGTGSDLVLLLAGGNSAVRMTAALAAQ